MIEKIRKYLPFFMQTPERKQEEKRNAERLLLEATKKMNYNGNFCAWVYFAKKYLEYGGNPRPIIKQIPREEKIAKRGYLGGIIFPSTDLSWIPAFENRRFLEQMFQDR